MNYSEILIYIYSLINIKKHEKETYRKREINVSKTAYILEELEYKQTFKIIHIAGTKGKGSTTLSLSSMLTKAGGKVGAFISPHIISERERISINGNWIDENTFISIALKIKDIIEKESLNISVFEFFTIMGLYYFYKENVDYACIETGIGGRLDCTNIVDTTVSIITSISYDHTNILGDTIEEIAFEKAGIIKHNIPIVSASSSSNALNVLKKNASDKNSPIFILGENFSNYIIKNTKDELSFEYIENDYKEIFNVSLVGSHQAENISVAFRAFRLLYPNMENSFYSGIASSIKDLKINGRMTFIQESPPIIVDGAHNGHSMKTVLETLYNWFPNIIILFAPLADKDIDRMCKTLIKYKNNMTLIVSAPKNEYKDTDSLSTHKYLESIGIESEHIESLECALKYVKDMSNEKNMPALIIGSLYTASEVINI